MRYLVRRIGKEAFLNLALCADNKRLHEKAISKLYESLDIRDFREYTGCPKLFYIELNNRLLNQARLN